jgi:predicted secreted protein
MSKVIRQIIKTRFNCPVEVELKSPGSSGYEWTPSFDASRISLLEKRRKMDSKNMGAQSKQIFRFKPLSTGMLEVKFALSRPWEKDVVEERDFVIQVS